MKSANLFALFLSLSLWACATGGVGSPRNESFAGVSLAEVKDAMSKEGYTCKLGHKHFDAKVIDKSGKHVTQRIYGDVFLVCTRKQSNSFGFVISIERVAFLLDKDLRVVERYGRVDHTGL